MIVFGWALTICESRSLFFISSWYVDLIGLFLCDDAVHKPGIVSEYDQEIPQLQTADNPVAP